LGELRKELWRSITFAKDYLTKFLSESAAIT
jgi:hypothetical protein